MTVPPVTAANVAAHNIRVFNDVRINVAPVKSLSHHASQSTVLQLHTITNPIDYLQKYPARIELLHLKDLKKGYHISSSLDTEEQDTNAELGAGVIDWRRLFAVARHGAVKHCFVEHEGEMDRPHLEAIKVSYDYLRQFS